MDEMYYILRQCDGFRVFISLLELFQVIAWLAVEGTTNCGNQEDAVTLPT